MESASPHKAKATELELILARWEQRYEWRRLSKTVPRSLMAALLISLVVGTAGYFRFRLAAEQLALITAGLCVLGVIANVVYTLVSPRDLLERARYFDLEFGLRERVSTAIELMHGRIKTHPEIEARQIAEALEMARAIDAKALIPMDFRRHELAALGVSALLAVGMILLPAIAGPDFLAEAPSAAVEVAREDLREIIEAVAKDTNLDDIDRQELLEALETTLERLQEEDISEEEAFAAMSQLRQELEARENELGETMELDQSTLEAALEALDDFVPQTEADQSAESASDGQALLDDLEELSQGLQQLGEEAAQMSPEEAAAAAEALRQAAEELAAMDQELSESMQSMAEALDEADAEALQEALDAAMEQAGREQQRGERDEAARQLLREQAERAEEAAEAIARRQAQEPGDQASEQEGEAQPGEAGQQASGQQGEQSDADSQQSASQGNQPADRNRPGEGENQQQNSDSRGSGAGAGSGEASNVSLPGAAGEDQGADTNNQTTGIGEIEYEALYSPSGISGGGDNEIQLRTDAADTTLSEGDFDDNPTGESRVRYDTVFSDYQNAANRALESDYVPLGLRDVVREYFTSLEPNSR